MNFHKKLNFNRLAGPILLWAVALFFVVSPVRAEMIVEDNKIYIGNDFKVFRLNQGERRKCQAACAKDQRCQAWTIVKPGPKPYAECRLKRDIRLNLKNNCCISGKKVEEFRAEQGKPGQKKQIAFCNQWSAKSVELAEINQQRGCGYRGRAWHMNEDRHFRYCMKLKRRDLIQEQKGQNKAVTACLDELDYGKQARCEHYARIAVAQSASRGKAGCSVQNKSRWSANYKEHYAYCLKADKEVVRAEQVAREKRLQSCFAFEVGGVGPCHEYAQAAIAQFRQNIAKGCDLHGASWHNNYRRHLSFCRKSTPKARKQAMKSRKLTLKTCRLFGKFGIQWR